jgi:hypothetical protein
MPKDKAVVPEHSPDNLHRLNLSVNARQKMTEYFSLLIKIDQRIKKEKHERTHN